MSNSEVLQALEQGTDPRRIARDGSTMLTRAIAAKDSLLVRRLLAVGAVVGAARDDQAMADPVDMNRERDRQNC